MIAFRLAWPAFAYSIEDESMAKRTYAFVLTYLLFVCCWMSLALGVLAPWLVKILAPSSPAFYRADEAVGLLAFAASAYAGYTVLAIGIGRARRTQFNWIVSGVAAVLNIALNFALIPPYGMMGAAVATAAAYLALFVGMTINSQHVYPVPYQWRRVLTLSSVAIALTVSVTCPARSCSRSRSVSSTRCCCCRSASTCRRSARASGASCRSAARGGRSPRRRASMPMPPAAASRSARPPSTSRGTGTPLPLPLSATGGDAIVETSTGASGLFVASLLDVGPLPRAALGRRNALADLARDVALAVSPRDRSLHRGANVVGQARVDLRVAVHVLDRIAVTRDRVRGGDLAVLVPVVVDVVAARPGGRRLCGDRRRGNHQHGE